MKIISLTQGKEAFVDDEDYEDLAAYTWYAYQDLHTWYARRTTGTKKHRRTVLMHRSILDAPPGVGVDHKNRDGLDNQRKNLRLATKSQNIANSPGVLSRQSPYKGVTYVARCCMWQAQIGKLSKEYLGRFIWAEEAARAYDRAARERYGEFAYLNFPEDAD